MVGGYSILDLQGIDVKSPGVTIPGAYNMIERSVGKPILLRNWIVSGLERAAVYVAPIVSGSAFFLFVGITVASIQYLVVESNDRVYYQQSPLSTVAGSPEEDGPSASM